MRVIIIDDGVDPSILEGKELFVDLIVTNELTVEQNVDQHSGIHGKNCVQIIQRYVEDMCIGSIKILDESTRTGQVDQLIVALKWCYEHQIDCIHMSIGTTLRNDFNPLLSMIRKLWYQGCVMVSACSNDKIYTVPACTSMVLGVSTNMTVNTDHIMEHNKYYSSFDFTAASQHDITLFGRKILSGYSNSYATPVVTASVINQWDKISHLKYGALKRALIQDEPLDRYFLYAYRCDFVDSAIVIGKREEITPELCDFEIKGIYTFDQLEQIQLEGRVSIIFTHSSIMEINKEREEQGILKQIRQFFSKYGQWILGVVSLGDCNSELEKVFKENDCVLWTPKVSNLWYQESVFLNHPFDKPLFIIDGKGDIAVRISQKIEQLFTEERYLVSCITENYLYSLYGCDYVKKEYIDSKILSYYARYYNLDLLLYVGHKIETVQEDILVKIENNRFICYVDGEVIMKSEDLTNDTVECMFHKVLKCFEED